MNSDNLSGPARPVAPWPPDELRAPGTDDDAAEMFRRGWMAGNAAQDEMTAYWDAYLAPRRVRLGWLPLVAALALAAGVWIGRAW